jgi:hypothetical protein
MNTGRITWRKASYSAENGGNCVEVGVWRKASYSTDNGGACVEVASARPAAIAVRDSKDPDGPRLAFGPRDWAHFITQVKAGGFDLS